MPKFRILADTNVIIGLEDPHLVEDAYSDFLRLCGENDVAVFVDDANFKDIHRDKNENRRNFTLSKIAKFQKLKKIEFPPPKELEEKYGLIRGENDLIDVKLLYILGTHAVNFLVTQDLGIHKRAHECGLQNRVFTVSQAVEWLNQNFYINQATLPLLESRKAYQIDISDPIFETLHEDYQGFSSWFRKCCEQQRDCWIIKVNNRIAGLVIKKDESYEEANTSKKFKKY